MFRVLTTCSVGWDFFLGGGERKTCCDRVSSKQFCAISWEGERVSERERQNRKKRKRGVKRKERTKKKLFVPFP